MKKLINLFYTEHNRTPDKGEIMQYMSISEETYRNICKCAEYEQIQSLDAEMHGADDEDTATLGDYIPSGDNIEMCIMDKVQQEQLAVVLWACVDKLPQKQRDAVKGVL